MKPADASAPAQAFSPPGECYRCGYDIRGIADDQACPECGLLAERSRRITDELHNTRPRWLRKISLGADLLLTALVVAAGWPFVFHAFWLGQIAQYLLGSFYVAADMAGFNLAAILMLAGVWFLTRPEGYEPADRADRLRRRALLLAACVPLLAIVAQTGLNILLLRHQFWFAYPPVAQYQAWEDAILVLFTFGMTPLPFLLFLHLRGLAARARSAHLAEHCLIVGIGAAALYLFGSITFVLFFFAGEWDLGDSWTIRSDAGFVKLLILGVSSGLFLLWALYLFVRFAVAFARASRRLRRSWLRDDRSVEGNSKPETRNPNQITMTKPQ